MSPRDLSVGFSGAIIFGYFVIGLFFVRFWLHTRDRLFGFFALAFWILAAERIVLLGTRPADIHNPSLYVTRLFAFLLIIGAIWDKNRSRHP